MPHRITHPSHTAGIVTLLACLAWTLPAVSQTDYSYEINDGQVTIGQYIGPGGAVTVPDQIEGLPVTAIGPWAFEYDKRLTSVRVPDSVTSVGEGAFGGCERLKTVFIGESTFGGCIGLTRILIPDSVTSLGEGAFVTCGGLTNAVIGNQVPSLGPEVFSHCTNLAEVTIGHSVTNLGSQAFHRRPLVGARNQPADSRCFLLQRSRVGNVPPPLLPFALAVNRGLAGRASRSLV